MTSPPPSETHPEPPAATTDHEVTQVLLVGSDRPYLDELRRSLEVEGVQIEQATGPGEAVTALERTGGRFRCAVLDVSVPPSDLLPLYGRLRPEDDDTPITILFTRSPFADEAPLVDREGDVYFPPDSSAAAIAQRARSVLGDVEQPSVTPPESRPTPMTPSSLVQDAGPSERRDSHRPMSLLWVLLIVVGVVIVAAIWFAQASG